MEDFSYKSTFEQKTERPNEAMIFSWAWFFLALPFVLIGYFPWYIPLIGFALRLSLRIFVIGIFILYLGLVGIYRLFAIFFK